jgi:hypothetical protein
VSVQKAHGLQERRTGGIGEAVRKNPLDAESGLVYADGLEGEDVTRESCRSGAVVCRPAGMAIAGPRTL